MSAPSRKPSYSGSTATASTSSAATNTPSSTTSGQSTVNRMIREYTRLKNLSKWLLICFLLLVIGAVIIELKPAAISRSAMEREKVGPNIAVCGRMVAVSLIDSNQNGTILLSTDSGKTFKRAGSRQPLRDTSMMLAFARDSATAIAVERSGMIHIVDSASAKSYQLPIPGAPASDSIIRGFVLVPGTDSIYLFGSFPGIVALDWHKPMNVVRMVIPSAWVLGGFNAKSDSKDWRILSLAIDPVRDIFFVAQDDFEHYTCFGNFLHSVVTKARDSSTKSYPPQNKSNNRINGSRATNPAQLLKRINTKLDTPATKKRYDRRTYN
ncbi:MAG TPA: hypothetical protein VKR32_04740 [Puia sp.]|nr:hypothetical protein [Puia sp.]